MHYVDVFNQDMIKPKMNRMKDTMQAMRDEIETKLSTKENPKGFLTNDVIKALDKFDEFVKAMDTAIDKNK